MKRAVTSWAPSGLPPQRDGRNLGKPGAVLLPRRTYAAGSVPWSVAIGDLNGDGKPDLATAEHRRDA